MILTLGQYLRVGRENAGFSLPGAADRIGIASSQISKYENDTILPKYPRLCELLKLYQYGEDEAEVIAAWQKRTDARDAKRPEAAKRGYKNRIAKREGRG